MFQFVTVGHPHDARDEKQQRLIRQHAIRNGIKNKREEEARRKKNFVNVDFNTQTRKLKKCHTTVMSKSVSGGLLDPFDSLPGDGERLRTLMVHSQSYRNWP